jgi:hypothetical protein
MEDNEAILKWLKKNYEKSSLMNLMIGIPMKKDGLKTEHTKCLQNGLTLRYVQQSWILKIFR